MGEMDQLQQDLRFVRAAVERADSAPAPRLVWFLWAALGLIGFALVDLRVSWVASYWTIAGPAGFVASALLGWRHARQVGQGSRREGYRQMAHWGAMLACVFLVLLMPLRGAMPASGAGTAILLVLALGYFQAGVHFDPSFRWIGLLLAGGYVFVLFVSAYAWLTLGVLFAVALVAAGLRSPMPPALRDGASA